MSAWLTQFISRLSSLLYPEPVSIVSTVSLSRSDDVAQGVVFLVQREQTGVWDLRVFSDADLFLSFKQQKRLEGGRRVHLLCLSSSSYQWWPTGNTSVKTRPLPPSSSSSSSVFQADLTPCGTLLPLTGLDKVAVCLFPKVNRWILSGITAPHCVQVGLYSI